MTKVLVLTTTFPRWKNDTTPAFVYELSKRLQQKGMEIVVLAPHHKGAKRFEVMDGMKVYRFHYFFPERLQKLCYDGGMLPNLKRSNLAKIQVPVLFKSELTFAIWLIKKEKIDIIHSHWIIPNGLVGAICKKIFGMRHITTAHAGDVFIMRNSKKFSRISKFILDNSDKITANSNYTSRAVAELDSSAERTIEVIPMGVDIERFNPKTKINLKNKFNSDYLIFSVGRLVEKKGIKYLVMAMKYIVKKYPDAKLIIGGDGPERKNLERLVENLNMRKNVTFLGYVKPSELPRYYASSDVFVLPSIETSQGDTEGLGVVILESLASGTPVVASRTGGIPEPIRHKENGLLSNPKDPRDIAEKIILILSDTSLRKKLSSEGRSYVQKQFFWDCIANDFDKLFSN